MTSNEFELGEVCIVRRGTTITRKDTVDGEIPVVAGGIKPTYYHNQSNRVSGVITISGSGANAGFINFWKKPIFASDCSTVEVKDKKLNITYVYYFLLSKQHYIYRELRSGAAQPHVYGKDIAKLRIKVPSLTIQQKIVTKLDTIFNEIERATEAAEANSKNAEVLFQSYLNSIFKLKGNNWITAKLNEICEKITDGTHQTPTYFDDGVIFLSSKNVTTGKIDWDNIKYIDTKQHIEMSKSISPKVGDILLAKNGTTGVAAMVDKDIVFNIYVSLALLRAKAQILPKLLLYFINSPVAKKQFNSRLKGSGVPNLHLQEIRQVEISFPKSLENQRELILQIESFLDATSILIAKYKNKKNEILLLKQAILKQAFNGELVKAA